MAQKLLNDPETVVDEMIEGVLAAHPERLSRLPEHARVVLAAELAPERVGIVIGGGSGHEPAFFGYVGAGLADAAAVGDVFASPPPDPIVVATRAVDRGRGVLHLYGNYAGDVMNFNLAAKLAGKAGHQVATVVVKDDVASAPAAEAGHRRGVAGDFFVIKAAGAAAAAGHDLDAVAAVAERANAATRTMGVGLSPCTLPQAARPNFELPEGEMEIGLGIHGEPGVTRGPLGGADAVADDLVARVLAEFGDSRGAEYAVLINGLGATPLMELYVVCRRVHQRLAEAGARVHRTWVGNYVSALEMKGCSVTVLRLDDELRGLLDAPADSVSLRQC